MLPTVTNAISVAAVFVISSSSKLLPTNQLSRVFEIPVVKLKNAWSVPVPPSTTVSLPTSDADAYINVSLSAPK